MDRRTYVLSTHPGCIEANYVEKRGAEINLLTRLDSQFFLLKKNGTETEEAVLERFDKNVNDYVNSNSIKDNRIIFFASL